MRLAFREEAVPYESGAQRARFWTEDWVGRELYCLSCGADNVAKLPNNNPAGDFRCSSCAEEYELKSQSGKIGAKVVDGAFRTMMERLQASNNPSLILLGAQRRLS